ncbi:3-mercaptopyruvate sulfurtransferase [Pelagibacterium limicola]|uniref:3-mercaptopyruvate sulfurtransferase n=1 Tax=Pelagibacterium limicola TaxID=2791022 RepID=UPI0018AF70B2|nr:3-mercaptopyruvate sulfurtransferase [Pelagibacterium limicola]
MSHFVSTDWLNAHLNDPDVTIVDGTWHLPNAGRNAAAEFEAGHIPGAVQFDIDRIADTSAGLPHMLPDAATFALLAGALGLSAEKTIVVYDEYGLFSAPRVWWTLRVMGAADVKILEGGGPKWRTKNRPLETGPANPTLATFKAHRNDDAIASFDTVLSAIRSGGQILDARPAPRFAGAAPEPRPGLRAGHMPDARNLPFSDLIADGRLKAPQDLQAIIRNAGIDPSEPVITSCGSGVTAAVLALALDTIGASRVMLYDGSWAEWGARDDAPVETD